MEKLLIGRKEIADLPGFGLKQKVVKIDSGAYTSSIDVISVHEEAGQLVVHFETGAEPMHFDRWETKVVRSSNGIAENRYLIKGEIILGGKSYKTKFTLSDRSGMRYPILLGRKLLNKYFIIDTSKINVLS